ncbi:conserved hypothetical protein [[Clostridium] ultunense Esp]|nr:conserved hypothetical protein [[Clostridium] ultunense Esp]
MENGKGGVMEAPVDQVLVEKLSDPVIIGQLIRLLDKLENVTFLMDMVEGFLSRGPEIADSVNELVVLLRKNWSRPEYGSRVESAFLALRRLQEFLDSPQVQALFKSDVLDVRSVQLVGKVARSMIQATQETEQMEAKRMGLFGLMKAVNDPEIQTAVHFMINFARNFSKELKDA